MAKISTLSYQGYSYLMIEETYLKEPIKIGSFKCNNIIRNLNSIRAFVQSQNKTGSLKVCDSKFKPFIINYKEAYCILENIDSIKIFSKNDYYEKAFESHVNSEETKTSCNEISLKEKVSAIANDTY